MAVSVEHLRSALELRKSFAIGTDRGTQEQADYLDAALSTNPERPIVIMPASFWQGTSKARTSIRDRVLTDYFITHVAAVGAIWKPVAFVQFQLVGLSKKPLPEVHFAEFDAPANFPNGKGIDTGDFSLLDLELTSSFDLLQGWLNDEVKRGFSLPREEVDLTRLSIKFHDPEFRAKVAEVEEQESAPLDQLAEIIMPRQTRETGVVLRPHDILKGTKGREGGKATNTVVQPKDILVARGGSFQAALVDEVEKGVTASPHCYVVRCHDPRISTEYLALYLNTEFAWDFAEALGNGGVLKVLSRKDFGSMPILLPEPEVLSRAGAVYRHTLDKRQDADRLAKMAKDRLTLEEIATSPLQARFLASVADMISREKAKYLKEIIDEDIKEITSCRAAGALKACMVLAGSVLEAILLEWVAELDGKEVNKLRSAKLADLIDDLHTRGYLVEPTNNHAHAIRGHRNIVHPTRMLKNEKLTEPVVDEALDMLKGIIRLRFT
ncbi:MULTISPECIES: restriction endonuclease subunit S [unclassified Mameliella]|uniref:restriction endonuclease subunit S n=1 Tax=unclassified Mameliella TaxID=2630630 RepID=UPI00273F0909|nr:MULTISPECIES: hypothetical protein [unclassified Mameliella]